MTGHIRLRTSSPGLLNQNFYPRTSSTRTSTSEPLVQNLYGPVSPSSRSAEIVSEWSTSSRWFICFVKTKDSEQAHKSEPFQWPFSRNLLNEIFLVSNWARGGLLIVGEPKENLRRTVRSVARCFGVWPKTFKLVLPGTKLKTKPFARDSFFFENFLVHSAIP